MKNILYADSENIIKDVDELAQKCGLSRTACIRLLLREGLAANMPIAEKRQLINQRLILNQQKILRNSLKPTRRTIKKLAKTCETILKIIGDSE